MDKLKLLQINFILFAIIFIILGEFPPFRLQTIVVSGIFCGISNASFTSLAIDVFPFTRSVSSAAYNFLRWAGAAIAPIMVGFLAQIYGFSFPLYVTAKVVVIAFIALIFYAPLLKRSIETIIAEKTPGLINQD